MQENKFRAPSLPIAASDLPGQQATPVPSGHGGASFPEDLHIFIPTYRRSERLKTWANIPSLAQEHASLVVRPQEYPDYRRAWPNAMIRLLPKKITNLSQTRQWILDNCKTRYCMMLDDDLVFHYRMARGDWHNKVMNTAQLKEKFVEMANEMIGKMKSDRLAHLAVGQLEGSNHEEYLNDWVLNRRYCRAVIFDLEVVKNFKYREDCCGVEDFAMALYLITSGYPSCIFYAFLQAHPASNLPGGLEAPDRIEKHNKSMLRLKELYPNFVKLREKTTKTSWGGKKRLDATIMWKKASELILQRSLRIGEF